MRDWSCRAAPHKPDAEVPGVEMVFEQIYCFDVSTAPSGTSGLGC
jgi:hypothetical protein